MAATDTADAEEERPGAERRQRQQQRPDRRDDDGGQRLPFVEPGDHLGLAGRADVRRPVGIVVHDVAERRIEAKQRDQRGRFGERAGIGRRTLGQRVEDGDEVGRQLGCGPVAPSHQMAEGR